MSVLAKHPTYEENELSWQALRDAYTGSGAVKTARDVRTQRGVVAQAGTRYLPRPAGMRRDDQYQSYKDRPAWRGATEVMIHGTVGAIFRREPQLTVPGRLEPQLRNITRTGIPLRTFVETVTKEVLHMARYGILVDFPQPITLPNGTVVQPPLDSRPYWCAYATEDIRNWHDLEREGTEDTDMIVLRECVPIRQGPWPTDDYFIIKPQERRRVLRLDEQGHYEVSLWIETPGSTPALQGAFTRVQTWNPRRQGEPLTFLPFIPMTPFSLSLAVGKSLVEALVEINYRHYRHGADYEQALHLTASPSLYICASGLAPQTEIFLGGNTAIVIPDSTATVGLVEFHGQGLQSHEHALETDIAEMATFGTRILEGTPLVSETATAVVQRTQGTESPIQSLIRTVSEGITKALRLHAWWAGMTEDRDDPAIDYALNNDLISRAIDPQTLTAWLAVLLNNKISYETFYYFLERGEATRPGITVDDEQALLETQAMQQPLAPMATNGTRNGSVAP